MNLESAGDGGSLLSSGTRRRTRPLWAAGRADQWPFWTPPAWGHQHQAGISWRLPIKWL